MWEKLKYIVPTVGFAILFVWMISACTNSVPAEAASESFDHVTFSIVDRDIEHIVYRHNETGVCYFVVRTNGEAGVTVMLNTDGTPYIWEEP